MLFLCFPRRGFSLQEALEIAYAEDVSEIYIEPPDAGIITDEDSGEEDGGGLIDNLPDSQLRAKAEIKLADDQRIGDFDTMPGSAFSEPMASTSSAPSQGVPIDFQTIEPNTIEWITGDLEAACTSFPDGSYKKYQNCTPVQIFEKIFDNNMIDFLVTESQRYALFLNCADPKISSTEMRCFLGILIVSGYNVLPGKRFYWDSNSDMRNELVYNAMRRNRFLAICRFLHFADNSKPDRSDKIWKMRPFMDKIRGKLLELFEPEENLCFDESMIKYFVRHSCKQFIRGKPIRFGYKMWSLNTPSGYIIDFEMYQGNNPRRNSDYEKAFGKSSEPLVRMLERIQHTKGFYPFKIYFDNLFTGLNLLKYLKQNGYHGTGTMREDRIPKLCPLPTKKEMEKRARGEFTSTIDRTNGIVFVRWRDNGVVTIASTIFGVHPIGSQAILAS